MTESTPESATPESAAPEAEAPREPIEHTIKEEKRQPGSLLVLSTEVPESVIEERVGKVLDEFRREATIPGFRRGKAPMKIVRTRLGKAARGETVARLVPDLAAQIVEERGIESLAEPRVENLESEAGSPVTFDLILEVKPEIKLPELSEIEVTIQEREINADLVEHQLEHIRQANAVLTTREGAVEEGDAVVADVTVTDHEGNRVAEPSQENLTVRTGEDDPHMPREVIDALVGKAAGQSVEVPVTRPIRVQEAGGEETREEEVTWTWRVEVKEVKSVRLPDLDDEFAKDVGDFDSLDALRERLATDLARREEDRQRDEAVGQALGKLLDAVSFDAPVSLVAQAQFRALSRDMEYLKSVGMSLEDLGEERMGYWDSMRRDAEQRVRAELMLEAVGAQGEIEVTDEDIDEEIARMAAQAGRKPLAIRAQLEARKQLDELRSHIRRRKTADHLLDQVKITRTRAEAEAGKRKAAPKKKAAAKSKPAAKKPAAQKTTAKKAGAKKKKSD
ncbi:trigger factor [Candidatus Sumerlaeota bacterium]|nr:trigger factor [Candidatus Sumerlaeota bacterium]